MDYTDMPLLLSMVFGIVVLIWLFARVGSMARNRGHSPWPWWLLSVAWSPIASMLILWLFFARPNAPEPNPEGEQS